MMKIVIVSNNYPSVYRPNYGAFVYNLAQELNKYNEVVIVSPLRINDLFKKRHKSYGNETCRVLRPLHIPVVWKKVLGGKWVSFLNKINKRNLERCIDSNIKSFDVFYCHFLSNGISVFDYAKRKGTPLIVASGESRDAYAGLRNKDREMLRCMLNYVSSFVCVSEENKKFLLDEGVESTRIHLIPNAVDYNVFRPLDKTMCKRDLGIPVDKFVVGFIGHFIERKGPNRVINALKLLGLPDVILVCVGNNGTLAEAPFLKVIQPVSNDKLPTIINSFDIFVLPTQSEGHCNVIEEVKACGVPIISSLGTTVEKQLSSETGMLIDPNNIEAIANAIEYLKQNPRVMSDMVCAQLNDRGTNSLKRRGEQINKLISLNLKKED